MSSQWNEDAYIEAALGVFDPGIPKKCIEFGAGDGLLCSNTAQLRHNRHWEALLIERQPGLLKTIYDVDTVLEAEVQISGAHSIDEIAKIHGFEDASLISIDVDGDEYHILQNMQMRPAILIVEFNPTIPPHVHLVGRPGTPLGCSLLALSKWAWIEGYGIYGLTEANAILLRNRPQDQPWQKRFLPKHLSYVISSYDGKTKRLGGNPPWGDKGEEIPADWIQELS